MIRNAYRNKRYDETGKVDAPVDNTDQAALGLISQLLAQVVAGEREPVTLNVVEEIAGCLRKSSKDLADKLAMLEMAEGRIMKLRGRFKTDQPSNALEQMLDWQVKQIVGTREMLTAKLKEHERATAILADYDFEKDAPMQHRVFVNLAMPGTSTSTHTW